GGQKVEACIDDATVAAAGDVTLSAGSSATINAMAIGGAGAGAGTSGGGLTGAVAGAGAGTINTIKQTITASIQGGSDVTTGGQGSVVVTATDATQITADAGGVAIAVAVGQGSNVAGSIGAAIATNTVANTVKAFIDSSQVTAAGGVRLSAQTQAN